MPDPNGKFRAMGLPVEQTSKSPALTKTKVLFFIGFVAVCAAMATTFYWFRVPGEEFDLDVWYGAMIIGFVLLTAFAFLATEAKTTAAAVSAGALGAVGTAFSGYIARTFIRSQESAASHLRAYFDQPLELSRYLAAERLLANAGDLTAEQRADILSSLVGAIATSGQPDVSTKTKQAHGQAV
jgi:hypothetical protein